MKNEVKKEEKSIKNLFFSEILIEKKLFPDSFKKCTKTGKYRKNEKEIASQILSTINLKR